MEEMSVNKYIFDDMYRYSNSQLNEYVSGICPYK